MPHEIGEIDGSPGQHRNESRSDAVQAPPNFDRNKETDRSEEKIPSEEFNDRPDEMFSDGKGTEHRDGTDTDKQVNDPSDNVDDKQPDTPPDKTHTHSMHNSRNQRSINVPPRNDEAGNPDLTDLTDRDSEAGNTTKPTSDKGKAIILILPSWNESKSKESEVDNPNVKNLTDRNSEAGNKNDLISDVKLPSDLARTDNQNRAGETEGNKDVKEHAKSNKHPDTNTFPAKPQSPSSKFAHDQNELEPLKDERLPHSSDIVKMAENDQTSLNKQALSMKTKSMHIVYISAGFWYGRACVNSQPLAQDRDDGFGTEWCTMYIRMNESTFGK